MSLLNDINSASSTLAVVQKTVGVILEERFYQFENGDFYSPSGFGDIFWQRYLKIFDRVLIVARVSTVKSIDDSWTIISDSRVDVLCIYTYTNFYRFLTNFYLINKQFKSGFDKCNAFIVRAPGVLACLSLQNLFMRRVSRIPIAVELVGDPFDVFNAGVGGKAAFIYKYLFKWLTQLICSKSDAVSYVTKFYLQSRYPASDNAFTISCSSVELQLRDINHFSRKYDKGINEDWIPCLFVAASLEAPYKGIDHLIKAISILNISRVSVKLIIAGGGRLQRKYEDYAKQLGVSSSIVFLGRISHQNVLHNMSNCDIYIQPSLTEGLPRSVIEACACGAPVLASSVGGVPEIVNLEDMFPAGNSEMIADLIYDRISNPEKLEAMSARNIKKAGEYETSILNARRTFFYHKLKMLSF